jgi:hypothetical protein
MKALIHLRLALALSAMLIPARMVSAQQSGQQEGSSGYSVEPAYKFIFGTARYKSNDISVDLGLPQDFTFSVGYNSYSSDTSSVTKTMSFGLSKDFSDCSFGLTYSLQPLQNDFKSHTIGANAAYWTGPKGYRTTFTATVAQTNDFEYISVSTFSKEMKITQGYATLGIKQQLDDTKVKAEFTGYSYSPAIGSYSLQLARWEAKFSKSHPKLFNMLSGSISGANGLLTGYPDWSGRFTLYQDIWALPLPVTLWGRYEGTHFKPAYEYDPPAKPINTLVSGITADSITAGIDIDFGADVSGTLQYNHVRETAQPLQDLYGASLSAKF